MLRIYPKLKHCWDSVQMKNLHLNYSCLLRHLTFTQSGSSLQLLFLVPAFQQFLRSTAKDAMAAHTIQFVHRFSYCCQNSNHQTAPKLMAFLVIMHFHVIIQHYFLLSKQQHYWLVAYRNCLYFTQVSKELLTFYLRDLASHNPLAKRVTLLLQGHLNQVYCMVFFGDICL